MSAGLFLQSISVLLFPFAGKLYEYTLIKGLKEFGTTLQSSVEGAIKADVFKKKIRARVIGKIESMVPLGRLVGTVIGFLVVSISLVLGFFVASFLLFSAFLIFTLFFKSYKLKQKIFLSHPKYSKIFRLLVLGGFLQSLIYGIAYLPGFFILAEKSLEITPSFLFILLFISYFLSTIIVYPSGKWIDKIGRLNVVRIGFLIFGVFIMFYAFVNNWFQFLLVLIGVSLSYFLWKVAFETSLYDSTIYRIRGEEIGFYRTVVGVGEITAPLIGGLLIDRIGLHSVFLTSGIIGIFTFSLFSILLTKIK